MGEEEYNRQILIHAGVPESAIHILPGPVVNTEQELQEAAGELRREGKTSVIFVTSPQHTRRVWTIWQKLAKNNPKAILHAAHDDPFDPDHWWRNTRDVLSVVRESLGLLNAWAGLPVPRPLQLTSTLSYVCSSKSGPAFRHEAVMEGDSIASWILENHPEFCRQVLGFCARINAGATA